MLTLFLVFFVLTILALCFLTTSITVSAAEDTQNHNGKKIIFTGDIASAVVKGNAGLSDLADGNHTISYTVLNTSDVDIRCRLYLQADGSNYTVTDLCDDKLVTIPKNNHSTITYTFTVSGGNITGDAATSAQSEATLHFDFKPAADYALGVIPAGTEVIIRCNQANDKTALALTGSSGTIIKDEAAAPHMGNDLKNACFDKELTFNTKYTKYSEAGDEFVDDDFHISGAFGDNMVLQRDRLVPVWGVSKKDIGKEITVTFGGQTKTTTVKTDGTWTVTLDKMNANKNAQDMVITCNGKTQKLTNILVGDVFFVGGQSNAEKTLEACGTVYSKEFKTALVETGEGNIRLFRQSKSDTTVDKTCWDALQAEPVNGNHWTTESVFTADSFSAIGIFFAHKVYDAIDIPVGMVMVCCGGSPLSQLMSKEASEKAEYYRYENSIPVSAMYNSLMHPFINMSFKGMLFYQGESEMGLAKSDYGKYNEYLKIYVEDIREKNGYNFSFYNVQLSSHVTNMWGGVCEQRAVQFDGIKMIDKAGLVVSMDHGFRSTDSDFAHPNYKKPIGERLAALALTMDYGIGDANYVLSPEPISAVKTAEGIVVTFKNVGDGLKRIGQHETLSGFRAMTAPAAYTNVTATITSKNTVLIDTTGISNVIGIAYGIEELAFVDYPEGDGDLKYVANLGNSEDLPAPTFKMLVEE